MSREEHPYISVVAASRNDEHGGNMLKRMRLFVEGLRTQANRYRFPVELVLVEWNPPLGRAPLSDVLPKPAEHEFLTLRYVTVPSEIHHRYRRAQDIPLFQMIAKNVGIRRARGEFILCTNVDLLFSDALFQTIAEQELRPDTYYRANRCDVPDGIDPAWTLDEQLDWCERNIIRRLGRNPRYKNINLDLVGLQEKSPLKKWLFNQMALGTVPFWSQAKREFFQLDLFACGDFTLMSREAWLAIHGYVELDLYSLHIDSLALIAANSLGYRQHVFPPNACTYHIDHPAGWQALTPLDKVRFCEQRPAIDYGTVLELGIYALEKREGLNLNPECWGYSDLEFETNVFPSRLTQQTLARGA